MIIIYPKIYISSYPGKRYMII